jgi:exodeoxyribonuclease V alpha subunit
MVTIRGFVKSIIFYNERTNYVVARFKLDQDSDNLVVVGYFAIPKKDELIVLNGEYKAHPKYGQQFEVLSYQKVLPNDEETIVRFLSSAAFPKVGKKAAILVVTTLGLECLKLIKDNAKVLDAVNISDDQKRSIVRGLSLNNRLEDALNLFIGYGLDLKTLMKMDAVYGEKMVEIVNNNPYVLVRDIDGLSFSVADRIAKNMGIDFYDTRRLKALTTYACTQLCYKNQDTYTTTHELYQQLSGNLDQITYQTFIEILESLINDQDLVQINERVYPFKIYEAEVGIAKYLNPFIADKVAVHDESMILEEINIIEKQLEIKYSDEQKQAIINIINNKISIITGGPGTGKTTVVKAIIKIYKRLFDHQIKVCAPTGRASKRIADLADNDATTIHRLLGWNLETNQFKYDNFNTLDGNFLIVDEFSMVDVQLFYHLLKATKNFKKILLIGDEQQLPPVMPGNVLSDLINSKLINLTRLVHIHRQSEDSGIIPLCYDVAHGLLNQDNLTKSDVKFIKARSSDVKTIILELAEELVAQGYDQSDIQVLAPMYDGVAGITHLNEYLREFFNPANLARKELNVGKYTYRIGDKILQLKNQPDDDVYNGDIGILEEVVRRQEDEYNQEHLVVNFYGNYVDYTPQYFINLTHAYCISVHKAQGSEYPVVILPIMREHSIMLKRKLIYTAISRAKSRLILIGDIEAFETGIKVIEKVKRRSSLGEFLKQD